MFLYVCVVMIPMALASIEFCPVCEIVDENLLSAADCKLQSLAAEPKLHGNRS